MTGTLLSPATDGAVTIELASVLVGLRTAEH